jgi:hypothetical protein
MKILVADNGDKVNTVANFAQVVKEAERENIPQAKSPQEHFILC